MPDAPTATHRVDLPPARASLALGVVFAGSLALAHAGVGLPALGLLSAWSFAFASSLPATSPGRVAALFSIGALLGYAWLQRWLIGITAPGYVGLVVVMAALLGAALWLACRASRRARSPLLGALLAGVLLAALEFARGRFIFSGYPWYLVAQPTIDVAGVPTLASLVGMHGVNALLCVLGAALKLPALRSPAPTRRGLSVALAGAALCAIAPGLLTRALARAPAPTGDAPRIAVVQTNVPQSNKQSSSIDEKIDQFARAVRLTRSAAGADRPDLVVWPETMFPAAALNDDAVDALRAAPAPYFQLAGEMRDALVGLQASMNVPLLVGAIALDNPRVVPAEEDGYVRLEHDGSYNSVFLLREGRVERERYDKMHLTPFGEVMPGISRWDWLERQLLSLGAPGMSFDLSAGERPVRFEVGALRIATPICFEATMPHVCRELAFSGGERRANVLINLTNDGWFGRSESGRRDHLRLARWRAAELATPVVRAANTGISCFIDARGRVYAPAPGAAPGSGLRPAPLGSPVVSNAFEETVLEARVEPGTGATLYARTGDALGWAVFAAGVAAAAFGLRRAKNPAANPPASTDAQA